MEWYPYGEQSVKMEGEGNQSMETPENPMGEENDDWPDDGQCENDQWEQCQEYDQSEEQEEPGYQAMPEGDQEEEWYQEQGEGQDPDQEQEWQTMEPDAETEIQQSGDPMDAHWEEKYGEDQTQEQPLPAPNLVPTPMRNRGKQPKFTPVQIGKGPGKSIQKPVDRPTPLSHPRCVSNPLLRMAGRPLPIIPPIMDPNHPVHRERGWMMVGNQWYQGGGSVGGWMPPQPPPYHFIRMKGQHPSAHNQPIYPMEYERIPDSRTPQYRITPPGMMGPNACNWDTVDPDSDYGQQDDAEQRRVEKRGEKRYPQSRTMVKGKPQKREVMLTIKGHQVPAHYWVQE